MMLSDSCFGLSVMRILPTHMTLTTPAYYIGHKGQPSTNFFNFKRIGEISAGFFYLTLYV